MTSMFGRAKQLLYMTGFATLILVPIESIRAMVVTVSICPLLLFSGGEYIVTGKQTNTEKWGDMIEFGGKDYVEKLAKDVGFESRIY